MTMSGFSATWATALLAAAGIGAPALAQTTAPPAQIFTCTNAAGKKLTSDRPIPECNDREQRVLNGDGSVRRVQGPVLTADERSEAEAREREATANAARKLEAIRGDFAREAIRRGADIRIAELDLGTLLGQDPVDLAKAEAKTREVAQLRADLRIARLRAVEQGKAVLTAEQRARLQTMLSGGMHHGMPATSGMPMPRRSADTGIRL